MSFEVFKKMTRAGFTCGSFDLLHTGHAIMLEECKNYCDYLTVGLQRDPSVDRAEKNRPIQSLEERLKMLEAIRWVDEIMVYDTESDLYDYLKNAISTGDINVRIIGDDWRGKDFTGHDLSLDVVFNNRDHCYSTSNLRKRVYIAESIKLEEV